MNCFLQTVFSDPCESAGRHDVTRIDEGYLSPETLLGIKGEFDEQKLFQDNPYGRMGEQRFLALAESLKQGWRENAPVTVFVEKDGQAYIHEGNHRLRAAAYAGIKVLTEIRYFGNSQTIKEIKEFSSDELEDDAESTFSPSM